MDDDNLIVVLENKIKILTEELSLEKSINSTDIKREYYKNLMISLRIIQKQKEEILTLKLKIMELDEENNRLNIMKFCL